MRVEFVQGRQRLSLGDGWKVAIRSALQENLPLTLTLVELLDNNTTSRNAKNTLRFEQVAVLAKVVDDHRNRVKAPLTSLKI